jgi:hypothetical protein
MFKNPLVAIMHLIIYLGFIIINIEVLEIVLDGLMGKHRLFAGIISAGLYSFLINVFEILAVGVIVVCIVFLARRNSIKLKRFISKDLNGWPRSDANYILITEIVLMSLFLTMNATDTLLQKNGDAHYSENLTGNFIFSSLLHPLFEGMSNGTLMVIERTCWWLHIAGIFAFLNYLPYSKHLHVILAFPNAYFARLELQGKMKNMPSVQNEVLYAMQPELAPTDAAPTPAPSRPTPGNVVNLAGPTERPNDLMAPVMNQPMSLPMRDPVVDELEVLMQMYPNDDLRDLLSVLKFGGQ